MSTLFSPWVPKSCAETTKQSQSSVSNEEATILAHSKITNLYDCKRRSGPAYGCILTEDWGNRGEQRCGGGKVGCGIVSIELEISLAVSLCKPVWRSHVAAWVTSCG